MIKRYRSIVTIIIVILTSVYLLMTVVEVANADDFEIHFNDRSWEIQYWGQWTMEQRESYLAGIQDAAEAIAFQMARGVGPKEILHSITKLFTETREDLYTYMYGRYEPTGSGRVTSWISREVISVLRKKNYLYTPTYLRNNIGRDD